MRRKSLSRMPFQRNGTGEAWNKGDTILFLLVRFLGRGRKQNVYAGCRRRSAFLGGLRLQL
jgi:hypothetical protein